MIHRVFDSLKEQTFSDFEWIIIDDGSNDNTEYILEEFRLKVTFPIKIKRRENRGKVQSINEGLDLAEGELFICFDSDDWCTPSAFERIAEVWGALTEVERANYAGLSCLKRLSNGTLVGEDYTRMQTMGETYVDRFNRRVKGDKWEVIRTDLHRYARYDLYGDEKYMAPEYAWLKIGKTHKTIFLNEALSVVEYQPEGISQNNLSHRISSPVSATRFYLLAWRVASSDRNRLRAAINYTRFRFHAGIESSLPVASRLIVTIPGALLFFVDMMKMRRLIAQRRVS